MNKEETDLIIAEQNKSTEEILKAIAKVKSDYHELCKLKDMRIAELEHQLTHRNCVDCSNHSSNLRMRNLELEKENAELEDKLANADYQLEGRDIKIKDLEKENAELKEQCSILADCNTCTSTCKTENIEMKKQLTNAKEIIKKFSEFVNNGIEYDPEHPQEHTDLWNKLCAEAEQFLNCSEKPNN